MCAAHLAARSGSALDFDRVSTYAQELYKTPSSLRKLSRRTLSRLLPHYVSLLCGLGRQEDAVKFILESGIDIPSMVTYSSLKFAAFKLLGGYEEVLDAEQCAALKERLQEALGAGILDGYDPNKGKSDRALAEPVGEPAPAEVDRSTPAAPTAARPPGGRIRTASKPVVFASKPTAKRAAETSAETRQTNSQRLETLMSLLRARKAPRPSKPNTAQTSGTLGKKDSAESELSAQLLQTISGADSDVSWSSPSPRHEGSREGRKEGMAGPRGESVNKHSDDNTLSLLLDATSGTGSKPPSSPSSPSPRDRELSVAQDTPSSID